MQDECTQNFSHSQNQGDAKGLSLLLLKGVHLHRMIPPVCTSKSYFFTRAKISVLHGEPLLRFHSFRKTYSALTSLL